MCVAESVAPAVCEALDAPEPVQNIGKDMLVAGRVCLRAQLEQSCARRVELIGPPENNGVEPVGAHGEPARATGGAMLSVVYVHCQRTTHRVCKTWPPSEQLNESEIREAIRCLVR